MQDEKNILKITKTEQYKTIDELFKRSQPGSVYYTLLFLSVFIIVPGLLLNNSAIVIGGMLVAPVLSPILVLALGISVGNGNAIKSSIFLILKSFAIIIVLSFLISIVFGAPLNVWSIQNTMLTAILYFIVALASGVAATFAWVRKEASDVLPGIAIAISLLPPLALIGIWLSDFNFEISRFYFLVFLFNLAGLIIGSSIIFTLLKFYKTEKKIQKKAEEVTEE